MNFFWFYRIWLNEILKTLPVIQQQSSIVSQQHLPYNKNLNTYGLFFKYYEYPIILFFLVPPSRYPDAPPIPYSYQQYNYPNQSQQFVNYNQPQPGFGSVNYSSYPPSNTTVIIDRGNNYGGCGYGFSGGSTMLGAGLGFGGGFLMGSLLSNGIGSHYGNYPGHFGSGYIQVFLKLIIYIIII